MAQRITDGPEMTSAVHRGCIKSDKSNKLTKPLNELNVTYPGLH